MKVKMVRMVRMRVMVGSVVGEVGEGVGDACEQKHVWGRFHHYHPRHHWHWVRAPHRYRRGPFPRYFRHGYYGDRYGGQLEKWHGFGCVGWCHGHHCYMWYRCGHQRDHGYRHHHHQNQMAQSTAVIAVVVVVVAVAVPEPVIPSYPEVVDDDGVQSAVEMTLWSGVSF